MSKELFRTGGPHNISKTGRDQYTLQIKLPTDSSGMYARECTSDECAPGSFKVKGGTGISGEQAQAYCPYCCTQASPEDFATREQIRYAKDVAMEEAQGGIESMIKDAFGMGRTGKRKIGGGMLSIDMSLKMKPRPPVRRPLEEQIRRDVCCPKCTLEHAVYGLAVWCPDCGEDIFVSHVESECQVLRTMLSDVDRRSEELGPRIAARDIENGLEDAVSIFEASLKAMAQRRLLNDGVSVAESNTIMTKKVRNRFQSYDGAVETLKQLFGFDLSAKLESQTVEQFKGTMEKRHPITHNLGIVDRKYLDKALSGEAEGRDVSLDEQEVLNALDTAFNLIKATHSGLFPST
tara:strand:+ start:11722 stop:12768 length:1047 start_codon:yes stop_codon:yes gene_type:complete